MSEPQLDLFSDAGVATAARPQSPSMARPLVTADSGIENLDDEALIAAISDSSFSEASLLAAEAGRRRLVAAIPALAALCRRFVGFGTNRTMPEQVAALQGLALIGGREAAHAVAEMIERAVVDGPTLNVAVRTAAQLRAVLSVDVLRVLLRHAEASVRANACRCVRPSPELVALMVGLLGDLDPTVARSAACALGHMGKIEARPLLKSLLRKAPTEDVIDAVASIADEECVVLLGRIARAIPTLADLALVSLENIDEPRAGAIAAAIRSMPRPQISP
jgi:HEAT repeat protein